MRPNFGSAGRLDDVIAESERRQRDWGHAIDRAAAPGRSRRGGADRGDRRQRARRRRRRDRHCRRRRTDDRGDTDVVAAVGVRGDRRPARRRGAADPIADRRRRLLDLTEPDSDMRTRPPVTPVALEPGARLAVTGPSGAGKTTLLMAMAEKPFEGSVFRRGCAPVRHHRARQSAGCPRRRNRR